MKILVTGGGTSGHISPALALIQTLREIDSETQFLYVGSKNGLEKKLVGAIDVPFVSIQTGKMRRYISLENLIDQFRIPLGILQSVLHLSKFKPDVVLATGGYVAVPPVIAASLLKIPIITHEQTVQIGLANQINARFATKIALSWESALKALPQKFRGKAWVAGNPVRPSIFGGERGRIHEHFGLSNDDLPVIYITGGSLGARVINRAVEEVLGDLVGKARIIHQCGEQSGEAETDYDRLVRAHKALPNELQGRYHVTKFVRDELRDVFAACELVVGRAGAGTVTELCAVGKAGLYIPLVPTGGDEQTKNAQMAVNAGAAKILKQSECNGQNLLAAISNLLADRKRLEEMGEAAKALAKPNAAREIAEVVLELGRK
jgi:UDP-N-acetylglucosamine--N-acetylmuramyl-(pentapeptide) pyrophosphoryl-undecaprenol N-acetylglucosamine transferase